MTFEQDTTKFVEWLAGKGVVFSPKVSLHDFRSSGQGRGLIALEDIESGELLFEIPATAILSELTETPVSPLLTKHELSGWPALITAMLWAADEPAWKPYFDILPTKFETPMFWEDCDLLQGSSIVDEIGSEQAEQLYKTLESGVLSESQFQNKDTSREAFHRMGSLISSYAFAVNTGEEINDGDSEDEYDEGIIAMVPPADMLNSHTKKHNARLEMPDKPGMPLEMRATEAIRAGQQIYNTYGELPNRALLRKYGYVEENGTEFDYADLLDADVLQAAQNLKIKEAEEQLQLAIEKSEDVEEADGFYSVDSTGIPPPALMFLCNWICAPKQRSLVKSLSEEELLPKAKELLLAAIDEAIKRYRQLPNPLDLPATENGVYTSKQQMCDQLIKSELEILRSCRDWTAGAQVVDPKAAKPFKKQRTNK